MWNRRISVFVVALSLVTTAGCVRRGAADPPRPERYLISTAELEGAKELTLYEAIVRLRPHFLRSRTQHAYGKPASVPVHLYVDGDKMDSLDDLRRLNPANVLEVRFYEPQIANTVFAGANNAGGVIAVILKSS